MEALHVYSILRVYMPTTIPKSKQLTERREKFREYMRKLNPVAPARTTIAEGLILDLHGSLFKTIAVRADLDPGSQQLLVGGIGSGKTTELLMAEQWLKGEGQTLPLYIDISSETDLAGLNSGALLAGFGLHLYRLISNSGFSQKADSNEKKELQKAQELIWEFAYGKTTHDWFYDEDDNEHPNDYEDHDEPPGYMVETTVPGKLRPIFPALNRDIQSILDPLEKLVKFVKARSLDVVLMFDGLDRLITPDKFWDVVYQDFRALKQMRVAVIASAPLSVLYGKGRSISDHFDRIHTIPTLSSDPENNDYLKSVLTHRGANDLLDIEREELVCRFSGGVLRDLITLARDAGEAAYIEGSDNVLSTHVYSAANHLGESYRRGLETGQIKKLQGLAAMDHFDRILSPAIDTELLVTGRILQYSPTDFRVHPALAQLIKPQQNG